MARRSATHDYSRPGIYHVTIHVAEGMGQPLGTVIGSTTEPASAAKPQNTLPAQGAPQAAPTATATAPAAPPAHAASAPTAPTVSGGFAAGIPAAPPAPTASAPTAPRVSGGFAAGIPAAAPAPTACAPAAPRVSGGFAAVTASVKLTSVGAAIEHELLTAITAHYPMVTVDTYVIMPEHIHVILIVRDPIVSKNGHPTHLGQVIAGFKTGCNRAYWAITGNNTPAAKPQGTLPAQTAPTTATTAPTTPAAKPQGTLPAQPAPTAAAPSALSVSGGFAAGIPGETRPGRPASGGKPRYASGRAALFAQGYCDVMPIEPGQLETQRAYIKNNPQSRWLRSHNRAVLQTQRGGIDTALTVAALRGYLQRECPPSLIDPDALAAIERRLLLADGTITCDSYGDRALLQRHLLPVVCHRKDAVRFGEQKRRCLDEAARGAVLVSARISPKEREIIDESVNRGFATIVIADNGFTDRYHPSAERIDLCAEGRLLLITPWQYQYRGKDEQVTVPLCKAMNCIAQALCRTKDSWWQTANKATTNFAN